MGRLPSPADLRHCVGWRGSQLGPGMGRGCPKCPDGKPPGVGQVLACEDRISFKDRTVSWKKPLGVEVDFISVLSLHGGVLGAGSVVCLASKRHGEREGRESGTCVLRNPGDFVAVAS